MSKKLTALRALLVFVIRGDFSPRAKRHARGLLYELLGI